jgi:hypothetical protein
MWSRLGATRVPPKSIVSAVTRAPEDLDVFAIDVNGGIYAISWDEAASVWQNWFRIGAASDAVPPGSVATAIARKSDRLDLFVVGSDGGVYNNSWGETPGNWQGWSSVTPAAIGFPTQTVVSALAQTPDRIDIFAVRNDSGIYSNFFGASSV